MGSTGYYQSSLNGSGYQQLTLQDKNTVQGGIIQIQLNPILRQEISLPKATTKKTPFFFCTISKGTICHILSSRTGYSEKVIFESYGSTFIVYNSANALILSEEYRFTENKKPIIYN